MLIELNEIYYRSSSNLSTNSSVEGIRTIFDGYKMNWAAENISYLQQFLCLGVRRNFDGEGDVRGLAIFMNIVSQCTATNTFCMLYIIELSALKVLFYKWQKLLMCSDESESGEQFVN